MPKVSAVPGSPQSSTSTVKDSVVVPADRMTAAVPPNVACLPPGVVHESELVITSRSMDWTFIRTSIAWSLYSRFPVAGQHFTTKPRVACALGSARLGIRAGTDRRSPMGEKTGSSPGIWPPPVTFPGVDGAPPRHAPPGAGMMSQGVKSTLGLTLSPEPGPTGPGPSAAPHQLHSASRTPIWPFLTPKLVLFVMLLSLMWISSPVTFQSVISLVFTPSTLLEIMLFVMKMW